MSADYYDVLNLPQGATDAEIRRAYRREALKTHPDRALPERKEESTHRFRLVAEAYETLSDPVSRAAYDRSRTAARARPAPSAGATRPATAGRGAGLDDLFEGVFGDDPFFDRSRARPFGGGGLFGAFGPGGGLFSSPWSMGRDGGGGMGGMPWGDEERASRRSASHLPPHRHPDPFELFDEMFRPFFPYHRSRHGDLDSPFDTFGRFGFGSGRGGRRSLFDFDDYPPFPSAQNVTPPPPYSPPQFVHGSSHDYRTYPTAAAGTTTVQPATAEAPAQASTSPRTHSRAFQWSFGSSFGPEGSEMRHSTRANINGRWSGEAVYRSTDAEGNETVVRVTPEGKTVTVNGVPQPNHPLLQRG